MTPAELSAAFKRYSGELGFASAGICPAVAPPGLPRFDEWLRAGYAGQMGYLADRRDAYAHPGNVMDGARSIVVLTLPYATATAQLTAPGEGRISRYAWGEADYHDLIRARLKMLIERMQPLAREARFRAVVDTAPLHEREFAQLAGLGWVGKNTLLLNRTGGSYFFLAAILTDLELTADEAHELDHCGTCRACLDACPTEAFPQPYVLDASRCISYLTIELRESIPVDLREGVGDWLFGCDVCQDVCPWNRRAPVSLEPGFQPRVDSNPVDLAPLFDLSDDEFRARFRRTPLWRSKRRGLLRNAAIVLGNRPSRRGLNALLKGLEDAEPLVRGASAWALGRHASALATSALRNRAAIETDAEVRLEIAHALSEIDLHPMEMEQS